MKLKVTCCCSRYCSCCCSIILSRQKEGRPNCSGCHYNSSWLHGRLSDGEARKRSIINRLYYFCSEPIDRPFRFRVGSVDDAATSTCRKKINKPTKMLIPVGRKKKCHSNEFYSNQLVFFFCFVIFITWPDYLS